MRLTPLFANRRNRLLSLTIGGLAGLGLVVAIGVVAGWSIAVAFGVVVLGVGLLARLIIELSVDLEKEKRERSRRLDRIADDLARHEATVSDAIRSLETESRRQSNDADAVLDRVRSLEHRVGQLDKILDRVRSAEASIGQLAHKSDKILDRVRSVEARLPPKRAVPAGQGRRIEKARQAIAEAEKAVSASGAGHAERLKTDAPSSKQSAGLSPNRSELADTDALVSIVVACHNEERFVEAALESMRLQSYSHWECIVVDDGSTDGSADKVDRIAEIDPRIRLIRHPESRGAGEARNTGMAAAKGEYMVFHDADDLMMADSLLDRMDAMRRQVDKDAVGVFCGVRIADEDVELAELSASEPWKSGDRFVDFVSSAGECPFSLTAAMLRTEAAIDSGGFGVQSGVAEDWAFWLQIMRAGFYFVASDAQTVIYRQKRSSKAQTSAERHVNESNRLIALAHAEWAAPDGVSLGSYPFTEPLAYYNELLTRSDRTIQYASTALLRSDIDAFASIIDTLDGSSWPLIERHTDIRRKAIDGFRRAVGLDVTDVALIESELEPLLQHVLRAVEKSATKSR